MKKLLCLLLTVCIFSSCKLRLTGPLKGNYPGVYTAVSNKSSDIIWNNIIQYCARNNMKIKLMDRKSGLIATDWYKIKKYTYENKDGTPENISADVILGCETIGPFKIVCQEPTVIWTRIIFKLKDEKDHKTSMAIRLTDLVAWYSEKRYLKEIKSTGFLEWEIINATK